ncbi:AEC family transporter [Bacillus sp. EB106-08-02-XG196]|uniref:AEC family transporter n=1 Tax=Bacillus sp. EB106-08-02-XG196 TaxID=2737049 RepID=UPI0015C41B8B|nr:AEC family transporter [Bacillus sp. EB106-08-02-XG196]NWQ40270.1 AEC family transporter [Bacillus sp. EB106-08-02-XG196]
MHSSGLFLQEMFVLYGIALLGFIARKKGILIDHANDVLTQLILNVTLPALILFSLDISFSYTIVKEFLWLVSMSVYILLLSIFLACWMSKHSKLPGKQKSVYESRNHVNLHRTLHIFTSDQFARYNIQKVICLTLRKTLSLFNIGCVIIHS